MKRIFYSCATLLLSGCGSGLLDEARKEVAAQLRDPESAQFRNLKDYTEKIVCGEVNAKNGFGGYVGFSEFIYFGDFKSRRKEVDFNPSSKESEIYCTDKTDKKLAYLEWIKDNSERKCAESGDSSSGWCSIAADDRKKIEEYKSKN